MLSKLLQAYAPLLEAARERLSKATGTGLGTWDELRLKLPIKVLHHLTLPVYEQLGYKLETRRIGDTSVGLLRLNFEKKGKDGKAKKSVVVRRMVFLPGFGDSPQSWLPVLAMLQQPVFKRLYDEVVLFDFPGSAGYLAAERPFGSMDHLRSAVFDLLDSMRPQVLMGHSLGAWLVAAYAIECGKGARPARPTLQYAGPDKIILGSPSGVLADDAKKEEYLGRFRRARDEGSKFFREFLFNTEPVWFGAMADAFMSFLDKPETHEFMNSVADKHMITDDLDLIRSKTWIFWGDKDTLVPSGWVTDWLERLNADAAKAPGKAKRGASRAVVIKGAGHSPQLEKSLATAAALGKILLEQPFKPSTRFWKRAVWEVLGEEK